MSAADRAQGGVTRLVAALIEEIPPGNVSSYGSIAEAASRITGRRFPALAVARVLTSRPELPWWRVVNARGELPPDLATRARSHWREEGVPVSYAPGAATWRVDLAACGWDAPLESHHLRSWNA